MKPKKIPATEAAGKLSSHVIGLKRAKAKEPKLPLLAFFTSPQKTVYAGAEKKRRQTCAALLAIPVQSVLTGNRKPAAGLLFVKRFKVSQTFSAGHAARSIEA